MAVTSILWAWVLEGMEKGTHVKDFEDLGVEDSSKGGGCKDYFNPDYVNGLIVGSRVDNE